MAPFPAFDRYDLAALIVSVLILVVVYAPPITSHLLRVAGWLTVATIYVGWMTFFVWKWMFEVEP